MLRKLLSVGDKIDIRIVDRKGKPMSGVEAFASRLIDFEGEDLLHIAAPIYAGKALMMEADKTYSLLLYTNKGPYQCNCTVLGSHKDNNILVITVRLVTRPEKHQRRQYYRLGMLQEIKYRLVPPMEEILEKKFALGEFDSEREKEEKIKQLEQYQREWMRASLTDLSAGGAKFTSRQQYNIGDKLLIKLDFADQKNVAKMELNAKVIASGRIDLPAKAFEHRVEFTDIMPKEREALIKYIFSQELKRRKQDKG